MIIKKTCGNAAKTLLRVKFIAIQSYFKNQEKISSKQLNLTATKERRRRRRRTTTKKPLKIGRRKELIMIRGKIN